MRRSLGLQHAITAGLLVLGAGCVPEFSADNPYDPSAPATRQAPAHLQGELVAEVPIALTDVQLVAEGKGELGRADATGRFSLELAPGRWTLSIVAPNHQAFDLGAIDLGIGETRALGTLHLVALRGRIAGTVALEGESSMAGTLVSVSKIERSVITNGAGDFEVTEVPVGTYSVVLLHQGFATGALEGIVVEPSRTTTITTTLSHLVADADFAIDGGARYVATASVTLDLYGFDLPLIQISEDPDFADAPAWQAFAGGSHPFTLSPGDGTKNVFVRFARSADDPTTWTRSYASSITLDTTPPVAQLPRIDDGSGYTHDRAGNVTLAITAFDLTSGLEGLRISIDGTLDTEAWTTFTPVRTVTVRDPTIDGSKPIIVQVRDLAGNVTEPLATTVVLDTSAPGLAREAVRINGGATYARSPFVSLTLGSEDAAMLKVGDESGLAGHPWQSYPADGNLAYQLPSGDGLKTVYVRFADAAGNETPEYSATITLDTTAPAGGTLTLAGGEPLTNSTTVPVVISSPDTWASVSLFGDLVERGDHGPGTLSTITLTPGDGSKVITAVLTDAAGNPSTPFITSIVLDTTAPAAGTVVLAGGRSVVASRDVPVSISDTLADSMILYEAASASACGTPECGSVGYLPFASPTSFTLSGGDGQKTVCWRLCDQAGNASAVSSRTLTLDTSAPTLTGSALRINDGANATRSPFVRLSFGAPAAAEVLVGDVAGLATSTWQPYPSSGTMTWMLPTTDGLKTVYVRFRDQAGNETAEYSASITLDTTAPAAPTVSLASGAVLANSRTVALSVVTAETNATIILQGDLAEAGSYAAATLPANVTLTTGDGVKAVSAQVLDAVGNASTVGTDFVTLDTTAPADGVVTLAGGRTIWGSTSLPVVISGTTPDTMQVWEQTGGACGTRACAAAGWLPFVASTNLTLTSAQGAKTVCWRFCDLAGNGSATGSGTITLDTVAPTLSGSALRINAGATVTRSPIVSLTLGAVGASELKVGDESGLAGRAWVPYPTSNTLTYTLPSGDGAKNVYVRFRDDAGNETAEYSASITLDTTMPAAGTVTLAGGAVQTNATAVTFAVTNNETGLSLQLSGDIIGSEQHSYASGAWPTTVHLSTGDGTKVVTAVLVDAAGNASAPFSDLVLLDTTPPADGVVTLANGLTTVNTQSVPVMVTNTAPDFMQLWEQVGGTCGTRACGTAGYVAFTPATSFTLSPSQGTHTVCWRFCDAAGNASATGSASVTLSTFLARPRPVLTSVTPSSLLAQSDAGGNYVITIAGAGIAFDTQALVGDFTLPCATSNGSSCQADLDGGCGAAGTCASTCASSCTVTLPAQLMRYGGTYGLRLSTPDPVTNGLNTSSALAMFSVLAPLPHLEWVRPRGVIQDTTANGSPIAQTVTVTLRGTGLMDNVSYRLGPNYGRVLSVTDVNYRTRDVTLEISTAGLSPSDLEDQVFAAVNPSPGGGEHAVAFGLSPRTTECPILGACNSNLRWTRAQLANGRGNRQSYELTSNQSTAHVQWNGGTAATLRRYDGALMARLLSTNAGYALPFIPGMMGTPPDAELALAHVPSVMLEDQLGTSPITTLGAPDAASVVGGHGDGTYPVGGTLAFGNDPRAIELVDLDGDGRVEPVTVNHDGNDVTIGWYNAAASHIPMGHNPGSLAIADLNGDGLLDLIVGGDDVEVRFNRGNRTFSAAVVIDMGYDPTAVAVGDLDRDGAPDLVVANIGALLHTRLGNGDGTFRDLNTIYGFGNIFDVALGDVNGDGYLDMVASSWGSTNVSVFIGNGAGGTILPRNDLVMGMGSVSVTLADVNLDGALDVLSPNGGSTNTISMRLGNGDGTFRTLNAITMGAAPQRVRVADLNGDGYPDLAAAGMNTANTNAALLVRLGNGDGTFQNVVETNAAAGANALAVADITQDGAPDIFVSCGTADSYTAYYGRLTGHGGQRYALPGIAPDGLYYSHTPVLPADVNRDGLPDIVAPNRANVEYFQASTFGGYGAAVNFAMGIHTDSVAYGDLNGDGIGDLVSTDVTFGNLYIRLGDGSGNFGAATTYTMGTGPVWVALGDLNADGMLDVVTANESSNNVSVRLGNGNGTLRTVTNYAVGTMPVHVVLSDVDADGDLDVITANFTTHNVSVLRNNGAGTLAAAVNTTCGSLPRSIAVGDLNGDGAPDLVCSGGYSGQETATVLPGLANGSFGAGAAYDMGATELHVALYDLNGDGLLDLVSANNSSDNDVGVRLGRSDGTFSTLARYPAVASPNGLGFADMNGDGSPDILVGGSTTNEIVRWTLPSPTTWAQELTELPAASNVVAPGTNTFTVGQAAQWVDKVAVRVRLTDLAAHLNQVTVSLTSPRGDVIVLDNGSSHAGATVWQSSYPTTAPVGNLTNANGWEPQGNWTLTVQNNGTQNVILEDFAVITHGAFQRPQPGSSAANPERLTFRTGTRWKMLDGNTFGAADGTNLSCVVTHNTPTGPGEHWYELTLATANTLQELSAIAAFDAAVEIRRGTCASAGTVVGCNDNGWGGRNPRLTGSYALTAGTYCIIVDGVYSTGVVNDGSYQLYVRLANNL